MAGLLTYTWLMMLEAKAAEKNTLSANQPAEIRATCDASIAASHVAKPPVAPTGQRGRHRRTKAHTLLLHLDNHPDDVVRFAMDFTVPFDNNLSERDVRMVKVAQKVSGGFRTNEVAQSFLAFRSYRSTGSKQGGDRLEALRQLFNDGPWLTTAPEAGPRRIGFQSYPGIEYRVK